MADERNWVGTWTMAPAPAETGAFNNQTLRMTMRASLGGNRLRVRISNAYGRRPLDIGGAHIALRDAGAAIIAEFGPQAEFRRCRDGDDRGGCGPVQRSGGTRPAAARRSRGQPLFARRDPERFSDHRTLCAADQLRLAAGRFHRGQGDADRQPHQRLVLRLRRRRAGQRRHRRHHRTRRFADRRQHLDDRRVLPLARPARPPPDGAPTRPADGGDEPGARRQPHPLRHPRRQRAAPV